MHKDKLIKTNTRSQDAGEQNSGVYAHQVRLLAEERSSGDKRRDAGGIVDEGLKAPKKQSDADAGVQSTDADASEVGGIVDEVPEAPKKQSGGLIASQSDNLRSPDASKKSKTEPEFIIDAKSSSTIVSDKSACLDANKSSNIVIPVKSKLEPEFRL
jgi:hypothetical protein